MSQSALYIAAEDNRRQSDNQLRAGWMERLAQLQADLKADIDKLNSDEARRDFRELAAEFRYFRDDHAVPLLMGDDQ